eukprot:2357920-Prorocentrum_lima.AAC.1
MACASVAMVMGHLGPPRCPKRGCMAVGSHQGAQPSVRNSFLAMPASSRCVFWPAGKACAL